MMAMNKKEQAAYDEAIDRANTLAAFHFTESVKRDVPPPDSGYTEGWDYNAHNPTVWLGWSSTTGHGTGAAPKEGERYRSGSQGSRAMFSTKILALKALRHEMEIKFANELRKVDDKIKLALTEHELP